MNLESLSSDQYNFLAPDFTLLVNDRIVSTDIRGSIIEVRVDDRINQGASLRISLSDKYDLGSQKYKLLDSDYFRIGSKISVKMGYENKQHIMFVGFITKLEPSFFSKTPPTLDISAMDLTYNFLKKKTPEKTFINAKYSDIARELAQSAGLAFDVEDTYESIPRLYKENNVSYYEFLEEICRKIGFNIWIKEYKLSFKKPEHSKQEILVLQLGRDIISFQPSFKATNLYKEVIVKGQDPANPSRTIIGKARTGTETNRIPGERSGSEIAAVQPNSQPKVISDITLYSEMHANTVAQAELDRANNGMFEGTAECIGIPIIRVGENIIIEKIGKRFSRKYNITGTTHTINNNGYRTSFKVGGDVSGILHAITGGEEKKESRAGSGVYTGIVSNNQDPDEMGRIKIKYPWRSEDDESNWIRTSTVMSGDDQGVWFLPEVGDEVLIVFGGGDINRPYVIGSLWNKNANPPESNSDGSNNIRKIKSRSGHEIIFDDNNKEKKEKLEIHTNSGHKIVLDDSQGEEKIEIKDKTEKNRILFDSVKNSINIESSMELKLKADKVEIEGTSTLTLSSKALLTIEGLPVKIN